MRKISLLLLIFFALSFYIRSDRSFEQDLGRHLKLGEIIWQARYVPKVNLFSYTHPDFPFINHHWLFQVVAFLTKQTFGEWGMILLKIFILIISVSLTLSIAKRGSSILILPLGFIFFHTLRERAEFRPEIFSFLFATLTYYLLVRFDMVKTRFVYFLPLIQVIWVNTHIYFPLGIILQAIFASHFLFIKNWQKFKIMTQVILLSHLAILINPNLFQGAIYPLKLFGNYGYTIVENQNLFWLESINFYNSNFLFVKISSVLVALSILISLIRKSFHFSNLGVAALGVVLALVHVRSFPYLAFLSFPAVMNLHGLTPVVSSFARKMNNLPSTPNRIWKSITLSLFTITAVFLLYESYIYLNGDYYLLTDSSHKVYPSLEEKGRGALDFMLNNNLPEQIYNNFDIGSYIIYRGYPKYKVYVDGRPEAYPSNFFKDEYIPAQYDFLKFKQLVEKYGLKTVIFSHTDQTPWGRTFLTNIISDPDWKLIYLDDFFVILVRTEETAKLGLVPIKLEEVKVESYIFDQHMSYLRIGYFLLSSNHPQSAKPFVAKALEIAPNSPNSNLINNFLISKSWVWW